MTETAAPKLTGTSAGQFLIRSILIAGASVCLALFMASAAMAPSAGMASEGAAAPVAAEDRATNRETHMIFVSGAGRMAGANFENVTAPAEPLAARNHLWMSPEAFARTAQQQQQQRPVTPPPVRPAPMPVAPPIMARPMPMPGAVATPPGVAQPVSPQPMMRPPVVVSPVISQPIVSHPIVRVPITSRVPLPGTPVRPVMGRNFVRPGPAIGMVLPGTPRTRMPVAPRFGIATSGALPVPPKFGHVVLEPGIGGTRSATFGLATMPVPPLLCNSGLPNCGFGFDGDFDDFGFQQPFLFFAFGGPFGFGGPCLFDGVFLNCFGGGWNGPFGWGWGTPWGYNPALTGSLYPIGGYTSPTPAEMNQESVNSIGPTTFAPSQPEQLMVAPSGELPQPAAYLVTKDGIEFGVTKYWVEDNQICYVTTYNVQSCISLGQLDLQTTVNINYKRGITFSLTPKQPDQD